MYICMHAYIYMHTYIYTYIDLYSALGNLTKKPNELKDRLQGGGRDIIWTRDWSNERVYVRLLMKTYDVWSSEKRFAQHFGA